MPDKDGFTTAAESAALEKQAEALLKADAKERGFIRPNGRGFSEYARDAGITTKKTLETTFKHETLVRGQNGFTDEEYLEYLGSKGGDPAAWVEMKEDLAAMDVEELIAAIDSAAD